MIIKDDKFGLCALKNENTDINFNPSHVSNMLRRIIDFSLKDNIIEKHEAEYLEKFVEKIEKEQLIKEEDNTYNLPFGSNENNKKADSVGWGYTNNYKK